MSTRKRAFPSYFATAAVPADQSDSAQEIMNSMRSGYKRTDIGVIPEDWECVEIDRLLSDISMGPFGSDIKVSNFVDEGVPVLDGFNVRKEKLLDDFSKFVTESKANSLKSAVARRGDIVVTHRGTIGQISYIPDDSEYERYVISQSQFRAHFGPRVTPNWITIYFLSDEGVNSLLEGKGQTGVPAIAQPTTTFRKLKIPLPSTSEQHAITTALSDADALIESLDRLISKKHAIKQAAMQQLLAGEIRLPGFDGEWETCRLGRVLRFQVGFPFKSQFFNSEGRGVRLVRNGDLKGDDIVLYYDGPYDSAFEVNFGDVLVGMDGEFVPQQWRGGKALLNQRVGRIHGSSELDVRFAYYRLGDPLREIERATSGTTVKHLSHGDVASIEILLPGIEEQLAIAEVLSDMDAGIEALESRRNKARQIKQGMMQELLRGRTRLVEPSTEAVEKTPA